ncbi:MAG: hypothetical protein mread185_000221 [Mycoplasmataceae bacterium]|nr:MAG: hypothetical protein mread185_000221 [Mycoplasmataceae bacterium]
MLKKFSLLREYELDGEIVWEYSCSFVFNEKKITKITITDHLWKKKGRQMITKELVCQLVSNLNNKRLWPTNYQGNRKPFRFDTSYQKQDYRLIFWFEDNDNNHLWIRNCFPIN